MHAEYTGSEKWHKRHDYPAGIWIALLLVIIPIVIYTLWKGNNEPSMQSEASVHHDTMIRTQHRETIRDSVVDFAMGLLGTSYVEGACSKDGFDCSGLVYFVFSHFNIKVPRSSSGFATFGKEVPIDKVVKGDVLVFLSPTRNAIGHVGIVVRAKGRQSDFIHASSGREMKVIITSLQNEGYTRRFVKAVNVIE